MRVLQLIDSLEAGGAERMAVNLANGLSKRIDASFLCATRKEGLLKQSINDQVFYLFLNKKNTIDFKAILKLNRFIQQNAIEILHAHSSSFFLATLIKVFNPRLILVWHDHYGQSEFLDKRPKFVLKYCSMFFNHILCVNSKLENWIKKELKKNDVTYLSNYAVSTDFKGITRLKGIDGKRIVCLANFRRQKDHFNLLEAFKLINKEHPEWTLHLIGHDFHDDYSDAIKAYINKDEFLNNVFIYGSCPDTFNILNQSTIGVLSSKSEGLPLALLEYGLAVLPVVVTRVGDCSKVISNLDQGLIVDAHNPKQLANAILVYIDDSKLRFQTGEQLYLKVNAQFSESKVLDLLIKTYKNHFK